MAGFNFSGNPADYKAPQAAQPKTAAPPPSAGPTGFWGRIAQVGVGKVNAYNLYKTNVEHQAAVESNNNPLETATKKTFNFGKDVAKTVAQPFESVGKKIGKQVKYLSGPDRSHKGQGNADQIIADQKAATKNTAYTNLLKQYGNKHINVDSAIQANRMAASGAKISDIKNHLDKSIQYESKQNKEAVGDTLQIASLAVGGGETSELLTGKAALAKGLLINTASGATGNIGSTIASGNTNKKDVIKSGVEGGIFGAATALAGAIGGKTLEDVKTILGKNKAVNSLVNSAVSNTLLKKANKADVGKIATTGAKQAESKSVKLGKSVVEQSGKMTDDEYSSRLNALGKAYDKETQTLSKTGTKGQIAKARANIINTKYEDLVKQLNQDYKSGVVPNKNILKATKQLSTSTKDIGTDVTPGKPANLEQKISRPTSETSPREPLENTNKAPATGVGARLQSRGSGNLNPELGAARRGNTEFANSLRKISSGDALANAHANEAADKFSSLFDDYVKKGGSKEAFVKDVESGKLGSQAHDFWVNHFKQLGSSLEAGGVLKNGARDSSYVPRIAKFTDKHASGAGGLSKTGGFVKGRAQEAVGDLGEPNGDLYKTHGEYKAAVEKQGGKVMDNPTDILRSATSTRLRALNHAEGLAELDKTPMRDGRAATITFDQSKGLPAGYRDYNTSILPGRAVHPEAVQGIKSIVQNVGGGGVERAIARSNSFVKRLVTLNGLVHGKNFALASIRENGLRGTATAFKHYSEEDVNRAIDHGFVPSRAGVSNIFDAANEGKGQLGRATSTLGKLHEKSQKLLFEGFGDKLGMSAYLHTEKSLIKQGLSKDEAGKVAADLANRVIFSQRSTETSAGLKEASRVAFFAGKYLQSTLATGAKVVGLGKNNALSEAAQRSEQRLAAKNMARGFTYLFAAAQAINYATTGHFTLQNKDSKISPVFYVDKSTGKEYHVTNWYGQIGDLLHFAGNPVKETVSKASPFVQEGAKIATNTDPFTGKNIRDTNASGPRQTAQVLANILESAATPLGFQMSTLNKALGAGGQPGIVTGAKLLGYGASSSDQNTLEKDISKRFYATLPPGTGEQKSQQLQTLEAAARHDLSQGKANSPNVAAVKQQLSPTAFTKFMKTGADTQVQSYFDGLPTDQKLEIIDKYSTNQLKELDLSGVVKTLTGSSAKSTIESLDSKGYNAARITQLLEKAGYGQSQMQQIKNEAKVQARIQSRKSRTQPKFVNPLLR